jgi:hypothetical protein
MTLENIDASDYQKSLDNEKWNTEFREALKARLFVYLSARKINVRMVDLRVPSLPRLWEQDGVQGFVLKESKGGDQFGEILKDHFLPADFAFGVTTDVSVNDDYQQYLKLKTQFEDK